jgi:hypothetical protein
MKHLKTYNQLINESKSEGILKSILDNFSKKVDSKLLGNFVRSHKDVLSKYKNKYSKDGIINADSILIDLKRFNFSANESYNDDYASNDDNNPVLRFLYKLFVRWPKNFVTGLWSLFKSSVVDEFGKYGDKVIGSIALFLWIMVSLIVFLIGYFTYACTEHALHGLDKGKVVSEVSFQAAHEDMVPITTTCGNSTITTYTYIHVPDRWHVEVKGDNGRIEEWETESRNIADQAEMGVEITNDNNWTWEETISK